jgi:transposase IS116/IS110/IS902 family protein
MSPSQVAGVQRGAVRRRSVGDHLNGRHLGRADGLLEEPAGGLGVSVSGDEHVDDLAELVDRAVDIAPPAGDLHIGLVHEPAVPDQVAAWPCGVGQQRREPLHPPVDGDVVDLDAALGQQLLDVAVGEAEAQVPADRNDDAWDAETIAIAASLRALAHRIQLLDAEIADHTRAITTLVRAWRPDLLSRCGVGPIVAAIVLCAWSHPGRCRSDAAFAMLGGAASIPASSGQTVRVRLNRSGDRHLNQALT